ncbi:MAG TPA: ATP-dependent Clp protease proteolytic subunit [Oscillospiraceae bacterium]|nr:ATP-dependent Clp protease proteolytic subunit [Oscillospiraceae bacterium]
MKDNEIKISETYNYEYSDKFDIEDNEQRRIYINSEIDENIVDTAVYHILRYNRLDKDTPITSREPIKIYINSPGGLVADGYALIDAIKLSKTPVYTINLANCLSMALLIFISGHKRFCMPHAEFLLHDGSSGCFDSVSKMQDRLKFESEQIEKMTKEYILSNTSITKEQYEMNMRKEWYFLPQEGKSIGVVDSIIGEDCELDEII